MDRWWVLYVLIIGLALIIGSVLTLVMRATS